jgi:hypothetical protein
MVISHGGNAANSYVSFGQRSTGNFSDNIVFILELEDGVFGLVSEALPDDEFIRGICVRDGASMYVYINKCLSTSRHDLNPTSNIQMQEAPWRIGYMVNTVFGVVNRSSGLSHVSFHPDVAFDDQDAADDYASATLGGIGPSTFSRPRDFTATVNATTGVVHFSWGPPSTHPELVTGYTLFESDGVTVVMPTDLVYDFEITLAPGTYTYKLRATNGVTNSAFVSVTFTVPVPPITGVDLFVIDDFTLENVLDNLTVEQVTV